MNIINCLSCCLINKIKGDPKTALEMLNVQCSMFNEVYIVLLISGTLRMVNLRIVIAGANLITAVRNLIVAEGFLKIIGASLKVAG